MRRVGYPYCVVEVVLMLVTFSWVGLLSLGFGLGFGGGLVAVALATTTLDVPGGGRRCNLVPLDRSLLFSELLKELLARVELPFVLAALLLDSQIGSRGEKSWRRAEKFPSGTTKAERSFSRSMQQSNALSPSSPRSRAKSPARHFDKLRQDVSDRERAAAPGEKRKNPLVVNPAYDPSFSLSYDPKSDSAFIPDDKAED